MEKEITALPRAFSAQLFSWNIQRQNVQLLLCVMESLGIISAHDRDPNPAWKSFPTPSLCGIPSPVSEPSALPRIPPCWGPFHLNVQRSRALQFSLEKKMRISCCHGIVVPVCSQNPGWSCRIAPRTRPNSSLGCEDAANNIHQRRNPGLLMLPSQFSVPQGQGRRRYKIFMPNTDFFTYLHGAFVLVHQTLPGCSNLSARSQLQRMLAKALSFNFANVPH